MNNVQHVLKMNERELQLGIAGTSASWHEKYADSAWIYVGGLSQELTEGDVLCVLSQFGEIEDFNMPRDKRTGKPRGWCWCKYDDQRSTILAVDNFNGTKLLGRTLRVDHCEHYKLPVELRDRERDNKFAPGAIYENKELASDYTLHKGVDVWAPVETKSKHEKKHKKKRKSAKSETKGKKRKGKVEGDGLLPYDFSEPLPPLLAGEDIPDTFNAQRRQGEVLPPSWRGRFEPGAPSSGRSFVPAPASPVSTTWEERELTRNRSYGGMLRRR